MTSSNSAHATAGKLDVVDLGRMDYAAALTRQREVNGQVLAHERGPTVLLVEHPPVITISRRREASSHLIASADQLQALGIKVEATDRGGDITYHGPGQLVVYPIIRLNEHGLNLGRYMRLLEQVVIDAVWDFGVLGQRIESKTGVWVGPPTSPADTWAKLCAMGVRVRKNTTMHGLALNLTTDLSHFQTIIPCGLDHAKVTSLDHLLGEACPSMEQVKRAMVDSLAERL